MWLGTYEVFFAVFLLLFCFRNAFYSPICFSKPMIDVLASGEMDDKPAPKGPPAQGAEDTAMKGAK